MRFREINLKLTVRLSILVILFLWSCYTLYFSDASFTWSVKSSAGGSLMERFSANGKFSVILQNNLLKVSSIFSSVDKVIPLSNL